MFNTHEQHVLRECLALDRSPERAAAISRRITPDLNWPVIVEAAAWHGVAPLMYRNLNSEPVRDHVPAAVLSGLKRAYQDNLIRNLYLEHLLGRVLDAFRDRGVACLVLKGMALAHTVYDDVALRPMGDLDLLILRDDLAQAEQALVDIGCELDGSVARDWCLQHHYEVAYAVPGQDVTIDLHWHISHHRLPTRIQIAGDDLLDAWRSRARPLAIAGREARILAPADTLFHLCQHFLKSRFAVTHTGFVSKAGLIHLCDIAGVARGNANAIDWPQLQRDAAHHHLEGMFGATLELALDTVPDDASAGTRAITRHLAASVDDRKMAAIIGKALYDRHDVESSLTRQGLSAVGGVSLRKRIASLFAILFPPPQRLAEHYGLPPEAKLRVAICYIIHPFSKLRRHDRLWPRLIRARQEARLKQWVGDTE